MYRQDWRGILSTEDSSFLRVDEVVYGTFSLFISGKLLTKVSIGV